MKVKFFEQQYFLIVSDVIGSSASLRYLKVFCFRPVHEDSVIAVNKIIGYNGWNNAYEVER
jgi:hypothetical protein